MNERLAITILAGVLAIGMHLFLRLKMPEPWRMLSISTLLLTGILLIYYHLYIFDPSHGIGILILPLATGWLSWRQERTDRPAISPGFLVALQIVFCLIFVLIVQLQEH